VGRRAGRGEGANAGAVNQTARTHCEGAPPDSATVVTQGLVTEGGITQIGPAVARTESGITQTGTAMTPNIESGSAPQEGEPRNSELGENWAPLQGFVVGLAAVPPRAPQRPHSAKRAQSAKSCQHSQEIASHQPPPSTWGGLWWCECRRWYCCCRRCCGWPGAIGRCADSWGGEWCCACAGAGRGSTGAGYWRGTQEERQAPRQQSWKWEEEGQASGQ